jgi:hypothetical protein
VGFESCEEAADLWVVELGVADEFKLAAPCDIGDAALEEGWVDAKDGSRAGKVSRDPGCLQKACREEGRAAWKQLEIAIAAGDAPFEKRGGAFAEDEGVGAEDSLGDLHDPGRDISF